MLMDQLPQIMSMKLDVLHFSMCNKIVSNLNCTLIITINNNWILDKKTKQTHS